MDNITINGKNYEAYNIPTNNSNILIIKGSKGFLACGYFSIEAADRLGDAVAIVTGVKSYDDMLGAKVIKVSEAAKKRGLAEGISGENALEFLI